MILGWYAEGVVAFGENRCGGVVDRYAVAWERRQVAAISGRVLGRKVKTSLQEEAESSSPNLLNKAEVLRSSKCIQDTKYIASYFELQIIR